MALPTPNLYWKFAEGSGTSTADSSGNSETGTLTGSVSWTTGKFDNAISVTSTTGNAYVQAPTAFSTFGWGAVTVAAWVKTSNSGTFTGQRGIVAADGADNTHTECGINIDGGYTKIQFQMANNIGHFQNAEATVPAINDGNWHHIVGTYDSATGVIAIYLDGASKGTSTGNTGTIGDVNKSSQGWRAPSGASGGWQNQSSFPGAIDEVRIYNTALSSSDVSTLYALTPISALTQTCGDNNGSNWGDAFSSAFSAILTGTIADAFSEFSPIADTGLVFNFGFSGEQLNEAAPDTLNDDTGTFTATVHAFPTFPKGHDGVGFHIANEDSYLSVAHDAVKLDGLAEISIGIWFKVDPDVSWASEGGEALIMKGNFAQDSSNEWALGIHNNDNIIVNFTSATNQQSDYFSALPYHVDDGQWHHIGTSYDGVNHFKTYLDGVKITDNNVTFSGAIQATATPVTIGGTTSGGSSFSSAVYVTLDDARVYSRVLTEAEFATWASQKDGGVIWTMVNFAPLTQTCADDASGNYADAFHSVGGGVLKISDTEASNWSDANKHVTGPVLKIADQIPNGASTVADGLLVFWDLDEGSGTSIANSAAGGGYAGTASSSGLTWVSGVRGDGLEFDASDGGYVDTASTSAIQGLSEFSVSIWFKATASWASKGSMGLAEKGTGTTEWAFEVTNNTLLTLYALNSSSAQITINTPGLAAFDDGNWHNAALTYDGTTVTIYLDGVSVQTSTSLSGAIKSGTGQLVIGGGSSGGFPYGSFSDGVLDEFRLWDRALTADEIADVFSNNITAANDAVTSGLLDGVGFADQDTSWGDVSKEFVVYLPKWSDSNAANWSDAVKLLLAILPNALTDSGASNWAAATKFIRGSVLKLSDTEAANWNDATKFKFAYRKALSDSEGSNWGDAFTAVLGLRYGFHDNASAPWGDIIQSSWNGLALFDSGASPWSDKLAGIGWGVSLPDDAGSPWSDSAVVGVGLAISDAMATPWSDGVEAFFTTSLTVSDDGSVNWAESLESDSTHGRIALTDTNVGSWADVPTIGYGIRIHDWATMPDIGLQLFWPMIENSGTTVFDWTGNGWDGAFEGDLAWIGDGQNDSAIYASSTDGTQYLINASFSASGFAKLTVVTWVQSNFSFGVNSEYGIVGGDQFALGLKGTEDVYCSITTGNGVVVTSTQSVGHSLNDNKWHMLAGVYDGSAIRIYVDGVLIGDDVSQSGAITGSASLSMPSMADASFEGVLDELRIYDIALSAEEIQAMYDAPDLSGAEDIAVDLLSSAFSPLTVSLSDIMLVPNDSALELYETCDAGTLTLDSHTSFVAGAFGDALRFDSTKKGEVSISSNTGYSGMSELTLSAWFKCANKSSDGDNTLLAKGYGEDSDFASLSEWWLGFNNNNSIKAVLVNAIGGMHTFNAPLPNGIYLDDDAWHNVAVTYDGTTVIVYFDGDALFTDDTMMSGAVNGTTQAVTIGNSVKSPGYSGDLDEVRVYSRALTTQEIEAIVNLVGAGEGFAAFTSDRVTFADTNISDWLDAAGVRFSYRISLSDDGGSNWGDAVAENRIYKRTLSASDDNSANWNEAIASRKSIALVLLDIQSPNWEDAFHRTEGLRGISVADDASANWAEHFIRGEFLSVSDDASTHWADAFHGVKPNIAQAISDNASANYADAFTGALEPIIVAADAGGSNWFDAISSKKATALTASGLSGDLSAGWDDAVATSKAAGSGVRIFEPPSNTFKDAFTSAPGTNLDFAEQLFMVDLFAWFSSEQHKLSLSDVDDTERNLRDGIALLSELRLKASDNNATNWADKIKAQGRGSQTGTCSDDNGSNWDDGVYRVAGNFIALSKILVDGHNDFADAWVSKYGKPAAFSDTNSSNWFELATLKVDWKLELTNSNANNWIDQFKWARGLLLKISDDGEANWKEKTDFKFQRTQQWADSETPNWNDAVKTFAALSFRVSDSSNNFSEKLNIGLSLSYSFHDQDRTNWTDAFTAHVFNAFGVTDNAGTPWTDAISFLFPVGRRVADNAAPNYVDFAFRKLNYFPALADSNGSNWNDAPLEFLFEFLTVLESGAEFDWADALDKSGVILFTPHDTISLNDGVSMRVANFVKPIDAMTLADALRLVYGCDEPAYTDSGASNWGDATHMVYGTVLQPSDQDTAWDDAFTHGIGYHLQLSDDNSLNLADAVDSDVFIRKMLHENASANWSDAFSTIYARHIRVADGTGWGWIAWAARFSAISLAVADDGGSHWTDAVKDHYSAKITGDQMSMSDAALAFMLSLGVPMGDSDDVYWREGIAFSGLKNESGFTDNADHFADATIPAIGFLLGIADSSSAPSIPSDQKSGDLADDCEPHWSDGAFLKANERKTIADDASSSWEDEFAYALPGVGSSISDSGSTNWKDALTTKLVEYKRCVVIETLVAMSDEFEFTGHSNLKLHDAGAFKDGRLQFVATTAATLHDDAANFSDALKFLDGMVVKIIGDQMDADDALTAIAGMCVEASDQDSAWAETFAVVDEMRKRFGETIYNWNETISRFGETLLALSDTHQQSDAIAAQFELLIQAADTFSLNDASTQFLVGVLEHSLSDSNTMSDGLAETLAIYYTEIEAAWVKVFSVLESNGSAYARLGADWLKSFNELEVTTGGVKS